MSTMQWVRRSHGWFGLWGAILGLLFGVSGVWLNHRAVLKLPLPDQIQSNERLSLPDRRPENAEAMAIWLQRALDLDRPAASIRVERSRPVPWAETGAAGAPQMQPERWQFNFSAPNSLVQIEYWAGNASVGVRTTENGFVATLTNLHKGVGMPVPWILLIDTLAGSLIFLSLSGTILWWSTTRRRMQGMAIFGLSVAATVTLALWPLRF